MSTQIKNKKPYRVFVTRNYIACTHYDVMATSASSARKKAVTTARRLLPDVRSTAVDNGWIADEPVWLECLGESGSGPTKVVEVRPDVYIPRHDPERKRRT